MRTRTRPSNTAPATDQFGFSRRRFLQAAAALGGTAALTPTWLMESAFAGPALGIDERVLVVLFQEGGSDSLNTLVPANDSVYQSSRSNIALSNGLHDVGEGLYFHPSLSRLKNRFDAGDVAIVRGVGHPADDRSHFDNELRMMSGVASGGITTSGWIGRHIDRMGLDVLAGASVGGWRMPHFLLPEHAEVAALPVSGNLFGANPADWEAPAINALRNLGDDTLLLGPWTGALNASMGNAIHASELVQPVFDMDLPDGETVSDLEREMMVAARLINANVGIRVLGIVQPNYDTHDNQPDLFAELLTAFDRGIDTFFTTLAPQFQSRTALMTFTEFGRRVESNQSMGTDHGTASTAFVVGNSVNGGHFGDQPSLTQLDQRGDMEHTVDFRNYYASVLSNWIGTDHGAILGAEYPTMPLFAVSPGTPPDTGAPPTLPFGPPAGNADGLWAVSPKRIYDSRDPGNGAVAGGTEIVVPVAGLASVPVSGAAAVLCNVTITEPTAGTFITVYPTGEPRPLASNLNAAAGETNPNLVLAKLGSDGSISLFNNAGEAHLIVDVVGYVPTGGSVNATSPSRIFDTRVASVPLQEGAPVVLPVAGQGGVPASGATAVIANVTVTEPTMPSYLTVYPADEPRPTASNLNFLPGQTRPNLVVCKLAADGSVALFNNAGETHVVVDVVGWIGGGGGVNAVAPTRILDSRESVAIGGASSMRLQVAGNGNVPSTGAGAVIANVTVTEPTEASYITVYPSGEQKPTASNLNVVAGQTVPNLVVCKLGADGAVRLYNNAGEAHCIVDVVGWIPA